MLQTPNPHPHRGEKLEALVQRLVAESLPEQLEGLPGFVTVTRVEVSKSARWGKIWISVLGGDDKQILARLEKSLYEIQGMLNRKLHRKIVPRISFFLDTSPRYAQEITEKIDKLKEQGDL